MNNCLKEKDKNIIKELYWKDNYNINEISQKLGVSFWQIYGLIDKFNIPLIKPYIRKGSINLSQRKLSYGLIHVRYNDKCLLELIGNWINEYIDWAGTQVAKGGRLFKSSVSLKGVMEK